MKKYGYSADDVKNGGVKGISKKIKNITATAEELGVGVPTLQDIIKELEKAGQRPKR